MTLTNARYTSDTYITGKLYDKLDAYMISQRPESKDEMIYWGSSNQFKTRKNYKTWLLAQKAWEHLTFKIVRGE